MIDNKQMKYSIDSGFTCVKYILKAIVVVIASIIGLFVAFAILSSIWAYTWIAISNYGIIGFLISAAIFIGIPATWITIRMKMKFRKKQPKQVPPILYNQAHTSSDSGYVPEDWQ